MSSGGWVFSILGMIVLLAMLAAAVVWIAREIGDRRGAVARTSGPEVLARRLASGEIKIEEYEELRRTLGLGPHRAPPPGSLPPVDSAAAGARDATRRRS